MKGSMTDRLDQNISALSMLGSSLSVQKSQGAVRASLTEVEHKWCRVLDELSWLCDYRTGGQTVTSIAAQATTMGNVFWYASNKRPHLLIQRHLQWILQQLKLHRGDSDRETEETRWKLFRKSIVFSRRRVEFYHRQLCSLFACVKRQSEWRRDSPLIECLERLCVLRDNHEELCIAAFDLRETALGVELQQYTRSSQIGPIWRAIRHYVGRLGSWWNACTTLVSVAELDANVFGDCHLELIPNRSCPVLQQSGEHIVPLSCTAERAKRGVHLTPLPSPSTHKNVVGARTVSSSALVRRQNGTYVHAELLVFNHFHRQNLAFAESVPYIGCSKPSCFCCHLYMELHPLTVLARPCHGNTWTRWAMPLLQDDVHGRLSSHDTRLLAGMIDRTQQAIDTGIAAGKVAKELESTTGISA